MRFLKTGLELPHVTLYESVIEFSLLPISRRFPRTIILVHGSTNKSFYIPIWD